MGIVSPPFHNFYLPSLTLLPNLVVHLSLGPLYHISLFSSRIPPLLPYSQIPADLKSLRRSPYSLGWISSLGPSRLSLKNPRPLDAPLVGFLTPSRSLEALPQESMLA